MLTKTFHLLTFENAVQLKHPCENIIFFNKANLVNMLTHLEVKCQKNHRRTKIQIIYIVLIATFLD